jgi:hypothetical protein
VLSWAADMEAEWREEELGLGGFERCAAELLGII